MTRVLADLPWRSLVTGMDGETLSILDRRATGRQFFIQHTGPCYATGQVASDDPEINLPYPTAASPALLTNNRRLLYSLRREPRLSPLDAPYVCRFGGILMPLEDEAGDAPTTRYTAYDPWQLMMSRPVRNPATGALIGPNNLVFPPGTLLKDIALDLLSISEAFEGESHIDSSDTSLLQGVNVLPTDAPLIFEQGLMVGEAWQRMCDTGLIEIALPPYYDPIAAPGKVVKFQTDDQIGSVKADVVMGWDLAGNSVADISRMVDGTRLADVVAYFASQAGIVVPQQDDATARAAYGDYWAQQFFPEQTNINLLAAQALAQLQLRKNGVRTINFDPAPERSDLVLRDYGAGDYIALWASRNLREPLGIDYDAFNPAAPGGSGYQRCFAIPIDVDDNGVTRVKGIVTVDESAILS